MRRLLVAVFACLSFGGTCVAAEKPGIFTVPAAVTVQSAPLGVAKPKSVKLARVVIDMPEDQAWASVKIDVIGPNVPPLRWKGGRSDVDPNEFFKQFTDVLTAAGFTPAARANLFQDDSTAELQIGAVISDVRGRFCGGCGMVIPSGDFRGAARMRVEWQIYSPLERRVLATVQTDGGYETAESLPGMIHLLKGAFRENVRQLINAEDFRRLVLAPEGPSRPQQSVSANSPIVFKPAPPKVRAISDDLRSVVAVFAQSGMGSGFLVSSDGYLLTNWHVVGESKFVKIKWSDGVEVLGEVVRTDARRDVALVKAAPNGRPPAVLRRGVPGVGDAVYAIGTPLDETLQGTVTKGIVSSTRTFEGLDFIQSDAAVTHGNSGGPLVDERGAVVGMTVSGRVIAGAPSGFNFFIPIDDALRALALKPAG